MDFIRTKKIKTMKRTIALLNIFFLVLLQTNAQDTSHVSLENLLQRVEANYPSLRQYQYNIQAIQARAEGATAWMPPSLSTGLMRFPYNLSMLREKNDPMNQSGIAFSLEQMIPNKRKQNANRSYINSLAEIEKSRRDWTENELRREAKILYYNRYIAERKQHLLRESKEILQLLITTAEEKFSNNQSQLQTIYKARARLAELGNMVLMLDGAVAESSIGLNILLVRDVNTPFQIDTLLAPVNYSPGRPDVSNRSDLTALARNIQSMKLEQQVMKMGARPDFGIRAEHMRMFGMPDQWSLMGMVSLPMVPWASRMYTSETKSIGFQIQSMEKERQTMELMAAKMVAEKLSMIRYENAQYQTYTASIIPAYEKNLQANLLAYELNTGDFFVLLDAWEMLLMKKLEAYDRLLNILKLEADYEYEIEIK
jgi:outer membrane protein, heavy metal efflux system